MTDRIIDLLPSRDLKRKIRELDFQFTQPELLTIILDYAPTYEQRLALLDEFAASAPPELGKVAEYFAAYQRELFRRFVEERDGFIYELHIRSELPLNNTVITPVERYICATYESALAWIDKYFEAYADIDTKETAETRYMIVKRKVFSLDDRFAEDEDSVCFLGPKKTLLRVERINLSTSGRSCKHDCLRCGRICPSWSVDILYPCFAFSFSIIRYRDTDEFFAFEGKEHLAICHCPTECCSDQRADAFYVIPLDCDPVRLHRFELVGDEHDHIPLPWAELVRFEDLDEENQRNYTAYVQWWKTQRS